MEDGRNVPNRNGAMQNRNGLRKLSWTLGG